MEVTTIVGIVVAIIICLIGLKMMLRKPNDAAPSLDSELHVNSESNQPVIPRHVRNQLSVESKEISDGRVEPSLGAVDQNAEMKLEIEAKVKTASTQLASTTEQTEQLGADDLKNTDIEESKIENVSKTQLETSEMLNEQTDVNKVLDATKDSSMIDSFEETPKKSSEFVINPNIATAVIQDYEEDSSILDVHLHEQQRFDDESALANADYIISLNVYPNPRKALSGDKTLKVMLKYGLRFGEMNCFHRYEKTEEVSPLMFSVLRITDQGPAGFDLESLSGEQVQGLAFFLALPHHNVQKGYDSMVSIAGLIARETDGTVYDENNLEFTPQLKEHWRHKAIDYRPGQDV